MLGLMLIATSMMAHAAPLADPTRPLANRFVVLGKMNSESKLPVLGSVLIGEDRRLAIINNRRYADNDNLGDYSVLKISESGVTLVKGSKTVELRLASRGVKGSRR